MSSRIFSYGESPSDRSMCAVLARVSRVFGGTGAGGVQEPPLASRPGGKRAPAQMIELELSAEREDERSSWVGGFPDEGGGTHSPSKQRRKNEGCTVTQTLARNLDG